MQQQTQYRTYAPATAEHVAHQPDQHLITVRVTMDHVGRYGHTKTMDLTYGASFPVRVGQTVLCPPTRLNSSWTRGTVVAVGVATGYRGRIKYVAQLGRKSRKK